MPDTEQKSRLATLERCALDLGRYALGKVSSVLGKEFLKIVLRGRTPETAATKPSRKCEPSQPVELSNGNTVVGMIRNNVLEFVIVTDKSGNTLEMEPEFFDTNLLNLKNDIKIPKFE